MKSNWVRLRDEILMSDAPQVCAARMVYDAFAQVARHFHGDDLLPKDSARVPYNQILDLHDAITAMQHAFAPPPHLAKVFYSSRVLLDNHGNVTEERCAISEYPEWARIGLGFYGNLYEEVAVEDRQLGEME